MSNLFITFNYHFLIKLISLQKPKIISEQVCRRDLCCERISWIRYCWFMNLVSVGKDNWSLYSGTIPLY